MLTDDENFAAYDLAFGACKAGDLNATRELLLLVDLGALRRRSYMNSMNRIEEFAFLSPTPPVMPDAWLPFAGVAKRIPDDPRLPISSSAGLCQTNYLPPSNG